MTRRPSAPLRPILVVSLLTIALVCGTPNVGTAQSTGPTRAVTSVSTVDRRVAVAVLQLWVPFSVQSATLGGFAQSLLDDKAILLQLNPQLEIRIDATGWDAASSAGTGELAARRNDAVRAYLVARGVNAGQLLGPAAAAGPEATKETRIGAGIQLASTSAGATLTALKATPTIVRTRPGFEVFALPRNLANDSVRILCAPPAAARLGVADTSGVVNGALLPKALVFVARGGGTVLTLQHDVSLIADPDRIDMTAQLPDPRCR